MRHLMNMSSSLVIVRSCCNFYKQQKYSELHNV